MIAWDSLVQQGILGTNRQLLQLSPVEGMAAIWLQLAAFDQETQFLQAAAILGQLRAANTQPTATSATAPLSPSPSETLAAPSSTVEARLRRIVGDGDNRLLIEWLHHAAHQALYLPHDLLPPLLDLATKERQVAEALAPCLGERGRWLMRLNPAWPIAAAERVDETDWRTGSGEARQRFLTTYRQADPDAARALVEATWAQEAAKDRALFVRVLRHTLSAADEPFLEQCLADRSQSVRDEAARLLAGLRGSRLQRQLLTELTDYLSLTRKWLRRIVQVKLPAQFKASWTSLGVRQESPLGVRIGQKAGWLVQLVALLPPSALVAHLGTDAVDFLELVRASDFAEALGTALLEGAEVHQDHAFLLAELHHLQRLLELEQAPRTEWLERFTRYAPLLLPALREQVLQRYLTGSQSAAFPDWTTLGAIIRSFDQLSPSLTSQLLELHLPALFQRSTRDYGIGRVLLDTAYCLAPIHYPAAVKLFARHIVEDRPEYIDHFLRIYQVRHQMEKEFAP